VSPLFGSTVRPSLRSTTLPIPSSTRRSRRSGSASSRLFFASCSSLSLSVGSSASVMNRIRYFSLNSATKRHKRPKSFFVALVRFVYNLPMKRSGIADLPLHGGRVPSWLAERMTKLGSAITETIVHDYGTSAFLSRLSDPFWFQALGAVMGMDWHSSGITTSVMGALKRGLAPKADELGIFFCGGRGRFSRNTPHELRSIANRLGFDGEALVRTSRLTARVDNNAIADGFQIYLHSFVVTASVEWSVVQQGLNDRSGMARRYHWHSASVRDFVAEPHTGIVGEHQGTIMNLVDAHAKPAQAALLDIAHEHPEKTLRAAQHLLPPLQNGIADDGGQLLLMPLHHEVRAENVNLRRLGSVLAVAYERDLHDFAELLLLEHLGPRTLQSLAL